MRIFTAAVVMLAMLTCANAQGFGKGGGGKRHQTSGEDRQASERKKADDTAYKSALEKIQPADQKPDPWKNMR